MPDALVEQRACTSCCGTRSTSCSTGASCSTSPIICRDRELYCLIYRDILPCSEKKIESLDNYLHWDCADVGGDATTWLRYYATRRGARATGPATSTSRCPTAEQPPYQAATCRAARCDLSRRSRGRANANLSSDNLSRHRCLSVCRSRACGLDPRGETALYFQARKRPIAGERLAPRATLSCSLGVVTPRLFATTQAEPVMKTERRHELQTNTLAVTLAHWIEAAKPYSRAALGRC